METLWKVETHAHTAPISPCGRLVPEQLAEQVRMAGYDALFVTDHYTPEFFALHTGGDDYRFQLERYFAGYRAARAAGEACGLRVFPGLEVRLFDGPEDYLVFGVSPEELAELPCLAFLSLEELHAAVRSVPDGLLVQAHPFRDYLTCQDARCLDGIEVCNANPRHDSHNDRALAYAQAQDLLMTAGSDVHQVGDAGGAAMYCPPFASVREFSRLLRGGQAAWRSER